MVVQLITQNNVIVRKGKNAAATALWVVIGLVILFQPVRQTLTPLVLRTIPALIVG